MHNYDPDFYDNSYDYGGYNSFDRDGASERERRGGGGPRGGRRGGRGDRGGKLTETLQYTFLTESAKCISRNLTIFSTSQEFALNNFPTVVMNLLRFEVLKTLLSSNFEMLNCWSFFEVYLRVPQVFLVYSAAQYAMPLHA